MSPSDSLHLVALRTVKYSDRHSILSAYTLQHGRMAFLIPAAQSREARRIRALLMPLSLVQCKYSSSPTRDLHRMHDIMPLRPLHGIHSHPAKATTAFFIADVLATIMRENQPDHPLFAFIAQSICKLDALHPSRLANFHIAFLVRLTSFLGIQPDYSTWTKGCIFDMVDGVFRHSAPLHSRFLSPVDASTLMTLSRISFDNCHLFRFTRAGRNEITDRLLDYYSIHITPLSHLTTLPVLRSL